MSCGPLSPESADDLRKLRDAAFERGDQCLGVLLAGVDLYVSLGREWDLIEHMRAFAETMKDAVENTPTADDLRRLYDWNPPSGA